MNFLFRRAQDPSITNIDTKTYHTDYFNSAEHTLVDVRTKNEFKGGHVPGAINIPLPELRKRLDEVANDKPIVVICASGHRSRTAAKLFTNSGYENVYNLAGGTTKWKIADLPLNR